jgi:hypothetical protein
VAVPQEARAGCDNPFGGQDEILELHLRMPRADWAAMRASVPVGTGCEAQYPYFRADFRCGNNEPWIPIGVRKKRGEQRGIDAPGKPPLKLDFNRFVNGLAWPVRPDRLGHRKLSLNNGQSDNPGGVLPSLASEYVAWRLLGREVAHGSRVVYAKLFVHPAEDEANPKYHGLYLLLEDIDRSALRRRSFETQGRLVKTTSTACRDKPVFDDGGDNQSLKLFNAWLTRNPGSVAGSTWVEETQKALDLEQLLLQEAARDILANNHDTVTGNYRNNYYAWDPMIGRRLYFPWDLDDSFGRGDGSFTTNLSPTVAIIPSCSDVGTRTRCHAAGIKRLYLQRMCQLINGTYRADSILQELDRVDRLIAPLLAAEAPLFDGKNPLSTSIQGSHASELIKIRDWVAKRIPEVRRQIQAAGVSCADGCPEGATEACGYLTCAGTRRCVNRRWTPCSPDPAPEVCGNGRDDNCNGMIDEGCVLVGADGGAAAGADGGAAAGADAGSPDGGLDAGGGSNAGSDAAATADSAPPATKDASPLTSAAEAGPVVEPPMAGREAGRTAPRTGTGSGSADDDESPGGAEMGAVVGCACAMPGARPSDGRPGALVLLALLAISTIGRRTRRTR